MAIKLTKNEQKVQKDHLKQYQRYLPTLQLKKQQLQSVIMQTKDGSATEKRYYMVEITPLEINRQFSEEAYGVAGGDTFILYAPGTPGDDIPADCRDWWPDAYRWRRGELEQLEGWGLCNVDTGQGFFTS